jgi:hypothetical protein
MTPPDRNLHTATSPQSGTHNPAPVFPVGTEVEVIINDRNRTYHRGVVASMIWHHKAETLPDRLIAHGKKISKRYEACDLRALPTQHQR